MHFRQFTSFARQRWYLFFPMLFLLMIGGIRLMAEQPSHQASAQPLILKPAPDAASSLYSYLPVVMRETSGGPVVPASGWPQYQFDAGRTGYNPESTSNRSFRETWGYRFAEDGIASTAQPIVAGQTVVIGTERGIVYAFNLTDGALLWKRQVDGAITHSAASTRETVFVGTLSGNIHALRLADGEEVWRFSTHGSFGSAVLLVEELGLVVLADRHGSMYALDAQSGKLIWQRPLGYRILQSPAFGDGRIYIGLEDMRLYALDATTGNNIWQTEQLYGRSFHDYAPVVAGDKVIVNVMPDSYTFVEEDLDLLREANVDISGGDLAAAQDATLQWLALHPEAQTSYAFEAATGRPAYTPGVLYSVVNSGAQPPPVYANGALYTAFHATSPMWLRKYWVTQDHGALGRMDPSTGRIIERLSSTPGEFTSDETNNYIGAGDLLIGARCQSKPGCTTTGGDRCNVDHDSLYPFTSDACLPGSAPIFAHDHIIYHAFDVLTVYAAAP